MKDRSLLLPRAQRPVIQHYVFDHSAPAAWTGPVVRRDPASYQLPSLQLTWRCSGRHCGHWTMPHAYEPDRCNFCGARRG